MLEVKNLCKTYRTKKGTVTKALDGVSLNFPETGMVFILGKSGSGKSTLLNVCGGLDKADSGEIIIKGKSSNEFSGQDFDSYRNTYVGFVFQEYNILDEFSVEENIGLALELQNKKRDKAVIDRILADVDLTDFAARKPNTLSGGQKQRVAIARALVKEPEIIMADEPTGALDSKTGQQVFDTLKKLSLNKLVIVISHDRDFAEQYADRIIELKDGKIISDQTRATSGEGALNVRYYGTDTVCVTNGAELTDGDLQNIKKFLMRSGGAAVISTSRTQIAQFKEDKPELNIGAFENIKEQPAPQTYEPQKLIRSHLPARHALRIGANSLKSKPVRLVFTIILSIMAFIIFGLASTLMLFDGKQTTVQTFTDAPDKYLILSKGYYGRYTSYINGEIQYRDRKDEKQETLYTVDEYKEIVKKYPDAIAVGSLNARIESLRLGQFGEQYYTDSIEGAILVNDGIQMLHGRKPEAADEIAISDYIYEAISAPKSRFTPYEGDSISITKPEDLLYTNTNRVLINIQYRPFKVVGIFKLDEPPAEYNELKKSAYEDKQFTGAKQTPENWEQYLSSSLLPCVMATEEAIAYYGSLNGSSLNPDSYFDYTQGELHIWYDKTEYNGNTEYIAKLGAGNGSREQLNVYGFNGNAVTELQPNTVALHAARAGSMYASYYERYMSALENTAEEQELINNAVFNACEQYVQEHLLVDKYFDQDRFNQDKESWQSNFEWAKQNAESSGETFDEEEYRAQNPEPTKLDKYADYGDYVYYHGDTEYFMGYGACEDYARYTSGTFSVYKKLKYDARLKAEAEYVKDNPEPIYPEDGTPQEIIDYEAAHNKWSSELWRLINEAENSVDVLYKLNNLSQSSLTQQQQLALFAEAKQLFASADAKFIIYNTYSEQPIEVAVAGIFFEQISEYCAYLADGLYDTYYTAGSEYGRVWSEYVSKYKAPENALISKVYIPYEHTAQAVQELVDLTYARGSDDSTAIIQNSQMHQLSMFIELADTLSLAFWISGAALALFAFLLMFNFISASITAKKKEIGILRAIGARTLDVYKIFISEAMIIALICFAVSTLATLGLCIALNNIITEGTFVVVSIFSFGPLSVLFIAGIALLTAVISTVIPVAIYSRKQPIESIRAI